MTRDPDELEGLLGELEEAAGGAPADLAERIASLRDLYTKELGEITTARAQPFAVQAARLRMWVELSTSRYDRAFAGRDRRTRDVALLEEIIEDLSIFRGPVADIHKQAPEHQMDRVLGQIDRALGVYQREATEIRAVRRQGTPAEQGTRLAGLANEQFRVYTLLFASQSRISRHPRTLARIVNGLEEIRRSMKALADAGFTERNNMNNLQLVDDRLRAFRQEASAIAAARAGADLPTRVSALATAANEIFRKYHEQYSGRSRSAVEADGLVDLFEHLWPVAREMDELDRVHDDETNARNLRTVTDNLTMYADEFRRIRTSKADST